MFDARACLWLCNCRGWRNKRGVSLLWGSVMGWAPFSFPRRISVSGNILLTEGCCCAVGRRRRTRCWRRRRRRRCWRRRMCARGCCYSNKYRCLCGAARVLLFFVSAHARCVETLISTSTEFLGICFVCSFRLSLTRVIFFWMCLLS